MWLIIKSENGDGKFEYQVSDGEVGKRTVSYDFHTFAEAKNCQQEFIEENWDLNYHYKYDSSFWGKRGE